MLFLVPKGLLYVGTAFYNVIWVPKGLPYVTVFFYAFVI
jgi:hypothetical protein